MYAFEISYIKAGWFEVKISLDSEEIIITNSDYLDNDAPAILLKNISNLLENRTTEAWLCWQDEPGAFIWSLKNVDDTLFISISIAMKDSMQLNYEGETLRDEEVYKVIAEISIPLYTFAKEVYDAFYLYSSGEKLEQYEGGWMPFPADELSRLKKLLR